MRRGSTVLNGVIKEQVSVNGVSPVSHFSFVTWNVDGLLSKLDNLDFVIYIASFDFISPVETFVETFQSSLFPEHTIFCSPALKLSTQGRRSGGIAALVRTNLLSLVREEECRYDYILLFIIDKECFGLLKDTLFVCVYIPPTGSPYYRAAGTDNGIGVLEECLAELQLSNDVHILLCGDVNARTSNTPYKVNNSFQTPEAHFHKDMDLFTRHSEDNEENGYGKMLFHMCSVLGLCILSGSSKGDLHGRYTYATGLGVTDYFIASEELYYTLLFSSELTVAERIESSHFHVEFEITARNRNDVGITKYNKEKHFIRIVWKIEKKGSFSTSNTVSPYTRTH